MPTHTATLHCTYGGSWGVNKRLMGRRYDGCVDCKPGNFSETWTTWEPRIDAWVEVQATECTVCPQGHFCEGAKDKTKCPGGTYQASFGIASKAACEVPPFLLRLVTQ